MTNISNIPSKFKVRINKVIDDQSWIVRPAEWQLCFTEGGNVVWNNTSKREKVKIGDELFVTTLWKENVISSKNEKMSEPRFYVDLNQDPF